MKHLFSCVDPHSLFIAISRRLGWSPKVGDALRYAVPLLAFVSVMELVHVSELSKPANDLVVISLMLVCAWLGGLGPALLITPVLFVLSRLHSDEPEHWAAVTSEEFGSFAVIMLICSSAGLAGQFRRRMRSITEQHAAKLEDQARALSLASILFRDIDGQITQWNEGPERLFGWTNAEAVGRRVHELLQSHFAQPLEEIQQELMRVGQWQGEVVYRHKDADELHVATHWILYRDKRGEPIGVAEIYNDVTELRRAEAAVREADRRKDEFLAVLAHELRNPLAPIRTGLELMRTVKDDPKLIEDTRSIMERQMRQLVTLVDDLLDVSRISRGKLQLRKCQVALHEIVESAVEAARPAIENLGHSLSVALPETSVILVADPNRLAQVLSNLLDNAAKYTPPGGRICLTAQCRKAECGKAELIISIKDNGLGVPSHMLDRIFEMFTRTENPEMVSSGLGIGLALAKSIIQMHGGRIEAHSQGLGQGSEFQVILPLDEEANAAAESTSGQSSHAVVPREVNADKPRVLIVDDNEAAASLLSILVRKMGNDVRVAHDGEEAIAAAEAFKPQIVLMDLGMPKLDGYGACRYIRQQPWGQNMLLVALTGWGQESHRQRAKEAGFDHHLVKPADPAQLQQLLAMRSDSTQSAGGR